MSVKRSIKMESESECVKEDPDWSPPSTPTRPAKKLKSTPSSSKSTPSTSSDGKSSKALLAEMIIEAGIKALPKAQVAQVTGFTAAQQKELLRKDRGSLRNALMATASRL